MGWKLSKSKADLISIKAELSKHWRYTKSLFREIFIDNAPRYKQPGQWVHLAQDAINNFCGLIAVCLKVLAAFPARVYTAGHVLSVCLVMAVIIAIYRVVI